MVMMLRTIGSDLERRRLEVQADRVERALSALDDRVLACGGHGEAPRPLREAIRGFETDLRGLRARIDRLAA